jgi:hypothetical protein
MSDRPKSLSGCARMRTKVRKKTSVSLCMGLVYDPREVKGVMTAKPGVAGVLQLVSEFILVVSQASTGQLRRIC